MFIEKYTLIIPFRLNNNSNISLQDDTTPFKLDNSNVEINLNENHGGNLKFIILKIKKTSFHFIMTLKK